MKNLFKIVLTYLLLSNTVFANDVFNYPVKPIDILPYIPQFENLTCQFTQTKTIPNSPMILKSGGDFFFNKETGVVFYTKYPIKMTTIYDKNEQVNKIISCIINRNFTTLEKNFSFYFKNKNSSWELGLIPNNPQIKHHLNKLHISGDSIVKNIKITNTDGSITKIDFIKG